MLIRGVFIAFVALCLSLSLNAQDTVFSDTTLIDTTEKVRLLIMRCPAGVYFNKSNLTAEIGGNGGLYSVNYQRGLFYFGSSRIFWSAGLFLFPNSSFIAATPLSLNWQKPFGRHHLILGAGHVLIVSRTKGGYLRGTMRAGYRWNFSGGKSFLEFAYTPFYSYFYNFQWEHWAGVAFGWNLAPRKK